MLILSLNLYCLSLDYTHNKMSKLKSQVVRDQNKRDYANRKGITLLEPTYKISGCKDIYDYLNKNLHKY